MFGLNASTREPSLIGTAAASLRATPLTSPKWPPKYTRLPFENAIVKIRGEQRGGQANPVIWPIAGPQAAIGALADRPISARCRRTLPPILVKSPPAKSWPFGPSRRTNTDRLAPGFHLAATPPRDTAATFERALPPTVVKLPPR